MYPNLRAEMARKNISQRELASLCGATQATISQILTGKRQLSFPMAEKIKDALEVDIPLETLFEKRTVA